MFKFDFVTSDSHFGHVNIIRFSERPFAHVDEMNGELIRRWNRVVGPTDVVVHLGDLAMGRIEDTVRLGWALNGQRYLIPGNHDRVSSVNQRGRNVATYTPIYEAAGWTILDEVIEATIDGRSVLLSHYPYIGDSHDKSKEGADRYADVRPVDTGLPLVHGHVHNLWTERGREFNAGVDVRDFTPVSATAVAEWMDSL